MNNKEYPIVRLLELRVNNRRLIIDLESTNDLVSIQREIMDNNLYNISRINPIKCINTNKNVWLIEVVIYNIRFYYANNKLLYMTFILESKDEKVVMYESGYVSLTSTDINKYCEDKLKDTEIKHDKWSLIGDDIPYVLGWNGYINTYAKKVEIYGNFKEYTRIAMDLSKDMFDILNEIDYYVNESNDLYSCVNKTSNIELVREYEPEEATIDVTSNKNSEGTKLKKIILNDDLGIEIDVEKDNINSVYCKLHQSLRVYNNEIVRKSLDYDNISYLEIRDVRITETRSESVLVPDELSGELKYVNETTEVLENVIQVKTNSIVVWGTINSIVGIYVSNPLWCSKEKKKTVIHELEDIILVDNNGDKRKLLDLLNLFNIVCEFKEIQPVIEYTEVEFEGYKLIVRDILGYSNFGRIGIEFCDINM